MKYQRQRQHPSEPDASVCVMCIRGSHQGGEQQHSGSNWMWVRSPLELPERGAEGHQGVLCGKLRLGSPSSRAYFPF